jgi:hypothetical protein
MTHYVYCHIRPDTEQIFYIGKGTSRRINSAIGRSSYWNNIVNKAKGFRSIVVATCAEESVALNYEKTLIKKLREDGLNLCNITDGGEGVSGYKHSLKAKETIGKKSIGNKSRTGQHLSDIQKQRMSFALTGRKHTTETKFKIGKKVYCITNNKVYPTQTEACKDLGLLSSGVSMCCRGKLSHTKGHQFRFATKNDIQYKEHHD